MEKSPQQHDHLSTEMPSLYRRHLRIITIFLGSFITILFLALFFTHHAKFNIDEKAAIPLRVKVTNTRIPQHIQSVPSGKWLTINVRRGDNLTKIFARKKLNTHQMHTILSVGSKTDLLRHLRPGNKIRIQIDGQRNIEQLIYRPDITTVLSIKKQNGHYRATTQKLHLESRQGYSHGQVDSSLFSTAKKNHLTPALISQLVDIFQWDIDFAKDIRKGDTFSIIYEENYLDGKAVSTGNILAAELVNQHKPYLAIRFSNPNGRSGYYTPNGRSLKRRFSRTPVKFTRISSRFTPRRWHPVLHRMRSHKGVDYAAPTGTPVKSTANGKIKFIGRKGGYGNAVIIQHGKKYSTLYGHLSRFAKHLKKSTKVKQGQVIGYVGMTGLATGPHLHYEFRINNKHHDPLTVKLPKGQPVQHQFKEMYLVHAKHLMSQLLIHEQTEFAANHKKHPFG